MLEIHSITTGPFQENCHILQDPDTKEIVVVDPGDDAPELVDFLKPLHDGRHDRFNAILVVMPDCALAAQTERSPNTREWINAVLHPDCPTSP